MKPGWIALQLKACVKKNAVFHVKLKISILEIFSNLVLCLSASSFSATLNHKWDQVVCWASQVSNFTLTKTWYQLTFYCLPVTYRPWCKACFIYQALSCMQHKHGHTVKHTHTRADKFWCWGELAKVSIIRRVSWWYQETCPPTKFLSVLCVLLIFISSFLVMYVSVCVRESDHHHCYTFGRICPHYCSHFSCSNWTVFDVSNAYGLLLNNIQKINGWHWIQFVNSSQLVKWMKLKWIVSVFIIFYQLKIKNKNTKVKWSKVKRTMQSHIGGKRCWIFPHKSVTCHCASLCSCF